MVRVREHIHGLNLFHLVVVPCQVFEVAGEGLRVAGDVHDAPRCEGHGGGEEFLVAAGAGRVHQQYIAFLAVCSHIHHEFAGVRADEADVLHAVQLRVHDGIAHGVAVHFHAQHLSGGLSSDHADGADAAVSVDDGLLAGQPGKFHRLAVEHLGLHRVDLVEGFRRNAELEPAEDVRDVARAVEGFLVRAQQHGGEAVVHVLDDRGDLRVLFEQRLYKIVLCREHGCAGDEHHHDLVRRKAALDEHMAQEAAPGHFVVGGHLEIGQQAADIHNDAVRGLVLRHAAVHGDDVVRAALINAGDDAPGAGGAERGLYFVSVMVGVFHPEDGLHMGKLPEELYAETVFPLQLFRVIQILQLAAAAFFAVRAAVFVLGQHT